MNMSSKTIAHGTKVPWVTGALTLLLIVLHLFTAQLVDLPDC